MADEINEKGSKAEVATKRQERLKRETEANKITFILETDVRRLLTAQAKAADMNIAPYMQKLVENYVMESAPEGDPLAERLRAKRALLDYAVDLARKTDDEGGFDEHFILNVMKKASSDQKFTDLYNTAAGVDPANKKQVARARVPLNQQLGRLIKRAAGAKSKRDANGKILRGQVQGEIVSTYTLLEKAA